MFWKQNQSPHIDTILVQEGLTLQDLLNQDSILQELKAQNKKLIDFLTRPEILEEMIAMITTEPSDDIDERERYRHPNIVCELLTTDLPFFSDKIINAESLLSKLYSFLESEPPLNPLLASFFSRTMGILLTRSQEQNWYSYQFTCLRLLEFLKSKGTCIQLLMKHLGTSAIMDLTLRLVTNITDIKMKQNILRWMDSQQLIQSIIDLLDPSIDADRHSSASQLLCDIIIRSRDSDDHYESNPEPNPILNTVESPKTVEKLLNVILCGEKCETSIVGGITALLTLLEPVKSSGQSLDQENQLRYGVEINSDKGSGDHADHSSSTSPLPVAVSTIEAILPYLPQLHDLLINPPKKPPIKLNSGAVDPPLGNTRIHVAKLLSALIASHHPDINDKLAELGTIGVLLDLFFTYTWNNFLHTQVEKCLAFALNAEPALNESSPQNVLLTDIFVKCQLIQRILSAWNDNEAEQEKPGGCRRGYMGHLIRIANNIASQAEKEPLGDFIKESVPEEVLKSWQAFVTNSLEPINKIQQTCLGGGVHPGLSSSQDDAGYGGDNPLSQDSVTQQSYSEYQSQQMASQFVENFGFHENEFNDNDDSLNQSVDQLTNIPFNMTEEDDLEHQAELFNQVCSRRLDTLCDDDDDDEDDEDLNKQWSSFRRGSPANGMWNGGEEGANYNSSDDEERPGPEGREEGGQMEIDQGGADMWCSPNAAESNRDPWSGAPAPADNEGWADFDANFGVATNINTDESSDVSSPAVISGSTSSTIATVPSPTAPSVPTSSNTSTLSVELPKDSENATAVLTSTAATASQTATGLFIRDSNANPSEDVNTDALGESQELMDNFRFLSSQGLMAATNGEITVEQPLKSNPGDKEEKETPNQEVSQSDEKIQSQPELEKVVVAVSATATTTVASPPSDNRGSDGSIKPSTIPAMDSSA